MKLFELHQKAGTYVGLLVINPSRTLIKKYLADNNIPDPPNRFENRRHVTVVNSDQHADVEPNDAITYLATPVRFEVLKTREGKRTLSLLLDAPEVVARHHEICQTNGIEHSHDDYKPHVTFSYDIGDLDISTLPPFTYDIQLGLEYVENATTPAHKLGSNSHAEID